MLLEDSENLQNNINHNDVLKISDENNEIENNLLQYKSAQYTTITNYYKDYNTTIDLSKDTHSLPSINVYVKSWSGYAVKEGRVKFTVDNRTSYTKYVDNTGHAYLIGDEAFTNLGTYTIKATYLGTSNYESSSTIFKYSIYGKTTIKVNDINVDKGKSVTITPKITPNSNLKDENGNYKIIRKRTNFNTQFNPGDVKIKINDIVYTLNSSTPSLTLNLDPGLYSCVAEYGTNPYYIKSRSSFTIKVMEEPLIVAQDYYITVLGKEFDLDIYVVDSNGNPINGGTAYLNKISAPVKNGCAHFTLNPTDIAFDYYTVEYHPKASYYKSVSIKDAFSITTISETKLTINPMDTIAGTTLKNIIYTITDGLNRKISPSGHFLINGKKYNSLADFKAPNKPGTYQYNVKFVPDSIYYANSTSTLKIVNRVKTNVIVKSINGKENSKVNVKSSVITSLNTPAAGAKVTFKIDGKTYSAKTNSKGIATVKVKVPKTETFKISSKTKNSIVTKTTEYKKNLQLPGKR